MLLDSVQQQRGGLSEREGSKIDTRALATHAMHLIRHGSWLVVTAVGYTQSWVYQAPSGQDQQDAGLYSGALNMLVQHQSEDPETAAAAIAAGAVPVGPVAAMASASRGQGVAQPALGGVRFPRLAMLRQVSVGPAVRARAVSFAGHLCVVARAEGVFVLNCLSAAVASRAGHAGGSLSRYVGWAERQGRHAKDQVGVSSQDLLTGMLCDAGLNREQLEVVAAGPYTASAWAMCSIHACISEGVMAAGAPVGSAEDGGEVAATTGAATEFGALRSRATGHSSGSMAELAVELEGPSAYFADGDRCGSSRDIISGATAGRSNRSSRRGEDEQRGDNRETDPRGQQRAGTTCASKAISVYVYRPNKPVLLRLSAPI